MYHEVSGDIRNTNKTHKIAPFYDIPVTMFESQLQLLAENGYKSLLFEDVSNLKSDGKYIILTFDDGLKGNYRYALPVLRRYGFRATIFIAVDRIGSERFMSWSELGELKNQGISIQSHTMTHRPLQTLNEKEIYNELYLSKKTIEKVLHTKVLAVSFPHGSYNQEIITIARQIDYEFMCTSNVDCIYYDSFQNNPRPLGRIALTNKINIEKFSKYLEYDKKEILKLNLSKKTKNLTKQIIGIDIYRKIYRSIFNIKLDKRES